MHPFLPQQKLFKAYDIRGDVRYFTDDFVWNLGQSFADLFKPNSQVVIGYDVRLQSESIARTLAYQLIQNGIQVIWLGQVTTPIMAYFASQNTGDGLIVTASHSESHINGIKWLVNHESPSSQDIAELFDSLVNTSVHLPSQNLLDTINHYPFDMTVNLESYKNGIHSALSQINSNQHFSKNYLHDTNNDSENQPPIYNNFAKFKLVIDCLNGATSRFAKSIFTSLGYDCVVLNDIPDGNFPKGNPDPTEAERLAELCQSVLDNHADIGLAFDGDGDRLMVVDSEGKVIAPDHLLYLLANLAIAEKPLKTPIATEIEQWYKAGERSFTSSTASERNEVTLSAFEGYQKPAVIFDVKCSHHLPILIEQQGGLPLMEKTGSSLMRKSLQNKSQNAIFAGELSGHFLFNDGYFVLHDDAMYAGIRLLNWLGYQKKSLSQIVADLPVSVSTADMYLPIDTAEMGQNFIANLIAKAKNSLAGFANTHDLMDEFANPILAQSDYQTPLTEFLPKQKVKKKKVKKTNKLPFFNKPSAEDLQPQNITTIDGLRLDFPQGFGILRKSNTGNFLTVRFAGNTLADLRHIQQIFVALCQSIDEKLAMQVARIEPQHF